MGGGLVLVALWLVGQWVGLAGLAKRWHDLDQSGWLALLSFIPVIGPLLCYIVAGFLRGTSGHNRFGPDPLAPEAPPGGYGGGYQQPYPQQAPGGWQPQGPPPQAPGGWGAPQPPQQGGGSVPPIRRG